MSSSGGVSSSTVNGTTRVTGLASGLDVDSIVEQLMTAEKGKKLNKLEQKEQKTEWTQTVQRSIISDITTFKDKYFSTTVSTSLTKESNYRKTKITSSDSAVTATSTSGADAGNHTMSVEQLATASALSSSKSVSKDVLGGQTAKYSGLSGKSIVINIDGTKRTVALDNVTSAATLQTAVDSAVGSGKVTVSEEANGSTTGCLSIKAADSGVNAITVSAPDTSSNSGLSTLGFSGTSTVLSNRLDTSSTLSSISDQLNTKLTFDKDGQVELKINGTTLNFDKADTLAEMISEVNKSDVGVTMAYDKITGKLSMTAKDTGAGSTLAVAETSNTTAKAGDSTSNFLSALLDKSTAGVDAKVTIDGTVMTRSSNTTTINGVTYTANKKTTSEATVAVVQDTDGVYDYIKGFADDYNKLILTINTELTAKYDSDYPPLTDDQKDDMTSDEITNWEKKGKVGLLHGDSSLKSLISDLRSCVSDSVAGQSSIFSMGISTSDDYSEKGKIKIDEDKLKSAISSDPEGVMNVFTQQATSKTNTGASMTSANVRTLSSSDLSKKYKEEGIAGRFSDVLDKNVSTKRDNAGNKGILLEKAGTTGDASDTDNEMSQKIDKYKDEISDEKDRLDDVNDKLYTKYSNLETYISKMNSQLSSITSYSSSS